MKAKRHCGKKVFLVSDFGEFFFTCTVCGKESNAFDSHTENPDFIEPRRIQFKGARK